MNPNEKYLKEFICSNCHICILESHPEEQLADLDYFKCKLCGFTKQIKKDPKKVHPIIYGRRKQD